MQLLLVHLSARNFCLIVASGNFLDCPSEYATAIRGLFCGSYSKVHATSKVLANGMVGFSNSCCVRCDLVRAVGLMCHLYVT